jgi:hypothetical protein
VTPVGNNSLFLPLVKAGENSGLMSSGVVYEGKNPAELLGMFKPDNQLKFLAALLVGKNKDNPFQVIVVADTDFVYDTFWSMGRTILDNNYFIPIYDNANFILNSLDYLSSDRTLILLRGHSQKIRHFDDMENVRKQNLRDFRIKENDIFNQISLTKKALDEVYAKRTFEERETFTADELAVIASTRKNLDDLRIQLGDIRKEMHKNLEKMSLIIKMINIYAIPFLIIAGLLVLSLFKNGRREKDDNKLRLNKEFKLIGSISILLLVFGAISAYMLSINDIGKYENKPVFEDLKEKINNIDEIIFTSGKGKLEFYKESGIWKLKDEDCLVVYQERIKSLLVALAEAVYYEKKSDKVEHLSKFGLDPIEVEDSPNIRIELKGEGQNILGFNLGKYDIDIGRGGRAAYIKFDTEFQVWMIRADLIDMSLDASDWTYSTLWNLRFGRLRGFGNVQNANRIMEMVKQLLNTSFIQAQNNKPDAESVLKLKLDVEDYSKVDINFMEQKDGDIWLQYGVSDIREKSYMEFFNKTASKCYYKINKANFGKIRDVIATVRQQASK